MVFKKINKPSGVVDTGDDIALVAAQLKTENGKNATKIIKNSNMFLEHKLIH